MLRGLSLVVLSIAAVAACGSSSSKSTSTTDAGGTPVDGGTGVDAGAGADASSADAATEDGGVPFAVMDQIYFGSASLGGFEIKLLDYAGACPLEQASDTHKANSEYIEIDNAGSTPYAAGTYTVGGTFSIALHQRDSICNVNATSATSGSLVVTSVDGGSLTGSFTATLPGHGTVTANIDATYCDLSTLGAPLDGGALGPGCVP